jgi:ABC-type multidrug transport system fused ATPase/permease subunit
MSRFSLYLRALGYYRRHLGMVLVSLVLVAFSILFSLIQPLTLAILIDLFTPSSDRDTWIHRVFHFIYPDPNLLHQIIALTLITLVLRLARELIQMYQTLLSIRVAYAGLMDVRCDLFTKIQELSIGYHRAQPQGDAIYRLSWDTFGFQTIYNIVLGGFVNVLTLVYMVVLMVSFNVKLTLVSLLVVPPLLWAMRRYGKVMQSAATQAKEADSVLTTTIQRSVAAISLVQAFGREQDEIARFSSTVKNSVAAWMTLHKQEILYSLVLGVIFAVSGTLLFGYGGYLVYHGDISIGVMTAFLAYLQGLYDPLNKLSSSGSAVQGGAAGAKRVFEVLDRDPVIRDAPGAHALPVLPRTITLDRVGFEYAANTPILRDVTCAIAPGQMVAFVGSSGVGKTTLLNLLPRFYDVTSGAFRLDDHDVRRIKIRDLRKHVALVLQESVILPTTIAENIAYGRPEATPAQIKRAAEQAGALPFIEKLPERFNTLISESGSNLSGGQRQRISIARALLTESPIIVLDEPTSALDPQTEQLITETLKSLRGSRTLIIVSHRLSTVLDCDQIFVMDEGRIAEQGTHGELIAKRGVYFAMAKHQLQLADENAPADPLAR